jgi:hypothetical protein
VEHRDAAGELGEPLLELLAIIVRIGFLDLRCSDGFLGATPRMPEQTS